jgi:hypothetical protein
MIRGGGGLEAWLGKGIEVSGEDTITVLKVSQKNLFKIGLYGIDNRKKGGGLGSERSSSPPISVCGPGI